MAALQPLEVTLTTKVRGLWKVTLLGWAIRLFRLSPAHVEVSFSDRSS